MLTKKALGIELSKLKTFQKPKPNLEQYSTEAEIASMMLWIAYMNSDIEEKKIADFGAGTGIIGIGALLLGAKKVYFVEKDKDAITVLKENLTKYNYDNFSIINKDVSEFKNKVDTVIMNPPFGVQKAHADKEFLITGFNTANTIYSLHKIESKKFIEKLCEENGFELKNMIHINYSLKRQFEFHTKKIKKIKIGLFIMRRK